MSYRTTNLPSHLRNSSLSGSGPSTSQSSALQQRINEKRAELESLKQLRDLSSGLAGQMEQLEEKLATLSNGTEAVAAVLSNWHTVLRAIHMASAHIPKPKDTEQAEEADYAEPGLALPQTLVRIPMQDVPAQRDHDAADDDFTEK
ncbi:hypothetical protein MBLNU459_g7101t1 [Dothideomycetes sp. NU459]